MRRICLEKRRQETRGKKKLGPNCMGTNCLVRGQELGEDREDMKRDRLGSNCMGINCLVSGQEERVEKTGKVRRLDQIVWEKFGKMSRGEGREHRKERSLDQIA
jgi:hypothetical protein